MRYETENVHQVDVHSDAYDGFEIICPECGGTVVVPTASWWSDKCECGISWSVSVTAVGYKNTEGEDD